MNFDDISVKPWTSVRKFHVFDHFHMAEIVVFEQIIKKCHQFVLFVCIFWPVSAEDATRQFVHIKKRFNDLTKEFLALLFVQLIVLNKILYLTYLVFLRLPG